MSRLPTDFVHPLRVEVPGGCRLRPITEADAVVGCPTVMGSRERLWPISGEVWGWPVATMTYEANLKDLERHAEETAAHQSFSYVLFDAAETTEFGCARIDPPEKAGADAEISWWVVDERVGTALERDLDPLVPRWIAEDWPFRRPRSIGRDLSWHDWPALPDA
ncbi:N-acetyltransferase [Streptomyces sp. NBC_01007]|nr:N-acetyltransferase [Streptomyces sp. NBC_01007]